MLKLVGEPLELKPYDPVVALADHYQLIDGYIRSHKVRNLAESTINKEEHFLRSFFEEHGPGHRPLYTWEVMHPLTGRKIVVDYGNVLVESEISTHTIRSYLGILRRYFAYILEHPLIFINAHEAIRISDKYGVLLNQPVSEFDMPRFVYAGEAAGIPFDPERLYEFYAVVRTNYLSSGYLPIRCRNYAMAVLAGETGLRVDELLHLEVDKDIFFESKKIQTRHAKAAKGSGKRCRVTLFPPLARDTLRYYLRVARPQFTTCKAGLLFPSKSGGPLSYANVQTALKEMGSIARKSGFPVMEHLSWHWFRRFFATRFVERFPNKISALVELLGHMSPNTVHRYIRHSEAWMDTQITEALEGAEGWR